MEHVYAGKPDFISNMVDEIVHHVVTSTNFNMKYDDPLSSQLMLRTVSFQLPRSSGKTTAIVRRITEHADSIMITSPRNESVDSMTKHFGLERYMGERIFTREHLTNMVRKGQKLKGIKRVYVTDSIRQRGYYRLTEQLLAVIVGDFITIKM